MRGLNLNYLESNLMLHVTFILLYKNFVPSHFRKEGIYEEFISFGVLDRGKEKRNRMIITHFVIQSNILRLYIICYLNIFF